MLTQDDLDEWRANPVTEAMKCALRRSLDRTREQMTAAYWAGRAVSEAERLALLREEALWDDLFQSSADDLNEAMKDA